MKNLIFLLLFLTLTSCDNDVYETHAKEGEFTVRKIKRSGKRQLRGFYVEGFDKKVKYSNIRNGKYKVGDKVHLSYDSVVNLTKGTYELVLQRKITD